MVEGKILLSICIALTSVICIDALALPEEVYNEGETIELGVWLYPTAQDNEIPQTSRYMPLLSGDYSKLVGFMQELVREMIGKNDDMKNNKALQRMIENVNNMEKRSNGDGYDEAYNEYDPMSNSIPAVSKRGGGRASRMPGRSRATPKRASLSTEVSMGALRSLLGDQAGRRNRDETMKGLFRMG